MRGQQFVVCSDLCTLGLERRDRKDLAQSQQLLSSLLVCCLFVYFFSAFFSAKLQVALFQRSISGKVLFQSKQL